MGNELNDDGRRCGVALHAVIGELAESHRFDISGGELLAYVGAHPQIASLASYKAAGRQRVSGEVATYLRWFAPESWSFIGREMHVGDRRVDLVWDTGFGVVFDEIKSDRVVVARDTSAHIAQTVALLEVGKAAYGSRFLGVRLIFLTAPRLSCMLGRDGDRADLLAVVR